MTVSASMRYSSMATKRRLASDSRKSTSLACLRNSSSSSEGSVAPIACRSCSNPPPRSPPQDDRLPQQFHSPADAAWCVALDDRGHVVGRRRDTTVASSRAFDRNTEQVSAATFMTSLTTTGSPCALPSGSPRAARPSAFSAAVRQDSGSAGATSALTAGLTVSMRAGRASITSRQDIVPTDIRRTIRRPASGIDRSLLLIPKLTIGYYAVSAGNMVIGTL